MLTLPHPQPNKAPSEIWWSKEEKGSIRNTMVIQQKQEETAPFEI